MSFIETRLLDCVAYGTEGGPTWATRKVGVRSGITRRNPRRSRPLYVFTLLYQNLLPENYEDVIAAFNACQGGLHGFRMRDWSDYVAVNALLPAVGTGAPQTVQLTKPYVFGSESIHRPIRKPVSGTVTMTQGGSPLTASIDYATGMATFTATAASALRWSGQFDVPVTFSDDSLPFQAVTRSGGELVMTSDITLEEDLSA